MNIADMVRYMTAAGCSLEQVNAACGACSDEAADRKRALTAERVRRHRERIRDSNACNALQGIVTEVTRYDTPSPKKGFPDPSKNTPLTPEDHSSEGKSLLPQSPDADAPGPVVDKPKAKPPRSLAKPVYTIDFERFWRDYPTTPTMGKKEAYEVWLRLAPEDRLVAIEALPAYRAELAKRPDSKVLHACRFLRYRRFDDLVEAKAQAAAAAMTQVPVDSRLFRVLVSRYRKEFGKDPPGDDVTAQLPAEWVDRFNAYLAQEQQA